MPSAMPSSTMSACRRRRRRCGPCCIGADHDRPIPQTRDTAPPVRRLHVCNDANHNEIGVTKMSPLSRWRDIVLGACLTSAFMSVPGSARADEVEDFYKGKTIRILVGHSVGGGYDLYARLLGRHLQ